MSELEKMRLQLYEQCAAKIMQGESPDSFFSPDGGLWETNILIGESKERHRIKQANLISFDRHYAVEFEGMYGANIRCWQGGWTERQTISGWKFSLNVGFRNLTVENVIEWIQNGLMEQVEIFAENMDYMYQSQVQSDDFQKILSDWTTKMGK